MKMYSDNFSLQESQFVVQRDLLYDHYFSRNFTTMDDFLRAAAVCFADVANFHHRMNYYFGSHEANDQVWYMAEWVLQNKDWPFLRGKVQQDFAHTIGTYIFDGILDDNARPNNQFWDRVRRLIRRHGSEIAAFFIRIYLEYNGIPTNNIPADIAKILKQLTQRS